MSHSTDLTGRLTHLASWLDPIERMDMLHAASVEHPKGEHALEHHAMLNFLHRVKRKAVLVGIRYKGNNVLEGTHSDVDHFKDLLIRTSASCHYICFLSTRTYADTYGYREADIAILKDDSSHPSSLQPTKKNIVSVFLL
jgi:hypothetical protein